MLDRTKIITELSNTISKSCNLIMKEKQTARALWEEIEFKENFYEQIKDKEFAIPIPTWAGKIGDKSLINPLKDYDVLAIDGSQIYPDRHLGINYFLINIGKVFLTYGEKSTAELDSTPIISLGCEPSSFEGTEMAINAKRTELELKTGLELVEKSTIKNRLFLFDGSIIFWHLQASSEQKSKNNFLTNYLKILDEFYEKKCLYAGYISLPKSRELINILRSTAALKKIDENFTHLIDSDILEFYLKPNERSILFKNNSHVTSFYPNHSHPYFFYLNTDYEIIRIEIPAWIAKDQEKVKIVETIIFDQIIKGQGYPVALSEAHNQAVISNFDKNFFNHLLHLTLLEYPYQKSSQKSIKKQRLSI